jgi:hypothetical protein
MHLDKFVKSMLDRLDCICASPGCCIGFMALRAVVKFGHERRTDMRHSSYSSANSDVLINTRS